MAALLNEMFVPVKVDREERPDVDELYMTVCQLATGQGGWPLTMFLTPERKPFFAATYIPREGALRPGRPAGAGPARAGAVAQPARPDRRFGRPDPGGPAAGRRARGGRRGAGGGRVRAGLPGAGRAVRPEPRRLRRRAQVPQPAHCSRSCSRRRDAARPGDGGEDPAGHARRRDLRPGRAGLPPLLHRRALARAALREDALRPGAAGPGLHRGLAGHRAAAVPPHRRGDLHLRAARPDLPGGSVLLRRGRGQRGRGGQVLPLEPGGAGLACSTPRSWPWWTWKRGPCTCATPSDP